MHYHRLVSNRRALPEPLISLHPKECLPHLASNNGKYAERLHSGYIKRYTPVTQGAIVTHTSHCCNYCSLLWFALILTLSLSAQPSYENYQLVWADEFSTDGLPDPANWAYEKGCSIRNQELQYYAEAREKNSRTEDGTLVIEANRESSNGCTYTSASLITRGKHEFQYGIFEIRAKIDVRQGSWPAFWTLGVTEEWPSNGEIDIMEYYGGVLHANVAWGSDTRWQGVWDAQPRSVGSDFSDDFHIWRMHWTKDFIDLWVDAVKQNSTDLSTTINGNLSTLKNPFHQKVYIVLNQAIGSNGGDPSATTFPVQFIVDYIRVYQEAKDTIAPTVLAVSGSAAGTVVIRFSEGVNKTAAEKTANYTLDTPDVSITRATLQSDGKTVMLTTSLRAIGSQHTLTIAGISDDATPANPLITATHQFTVSPASTRLTGTLIGKGTPYDMSTSLTYDNAMDGNTATFADCTGDTVWVGYDLGSTALTVVTGLRYFPRAGYADRMVGKSFEISRDGTTWEKVYTIADLPPEGSFTTIAIPDSRPIRYIRYNGTGGYLNVSEIEFLGYQPPSSELVMDHLDSDITTGTKNLTPPLRVFFVSLDGKTIAQKQIGTTKGLEYLRWPKRALLCSGKVSPGGVVIMHIEDCNGKHVQRVVMQPK